MLWCSNLPRRPCSRASCVRDRWCAMVCMPWHRECRALAERVHHGLRIATRVASVLGCSHEGPVDRSGGRAYWVVGKQRLRTRHARVGTPHGRVRLLSEGAVAHLDRFHFCTRKPSWHPARAATRVGGRMARRPSTRVRTPTACACTCESRRVSCHGWEVGSRTTVALFWMLGAHAIVCARARENGWTRPCVRHGAVSSHRKPR